MFSLYDSEHWSRGLQKREEDTYLVLIFPSIK